MIVVSVLVLRTLSNQNEFIAKLLIDLAVSVERQLQLHILL